MAQFPGAGYPASYWRPVPLVVIEGETGQIYYGEVIHARELELAVHLDSLAEATVSNGRLIMAEVEAFQLVERSVTHARGVTCEVTVYPVTEMVAPVNRHADFDVHILDRRRITAKEPALAAV